MKKLLSLFFIVMFSLVLAACATTTTGGTTARTTTGTTATTNPNATTVTFASWGVGTAEENNILRRRITKFNETHTDIQIQIVEYQGSWDDFLATKAAAGEFPDVVIVGNVPDYVVKDYIGDISDVIANDADWNKIPQALRDSVTYGDKVYAIPAAYHYLGYYANLDLIDESGVTADFDNFDYTTEEFFTAISAMKDTNVTDGTGTIGITNAVDFVNWLPSEYDTTGTIQHFVWNGTNFDFNGQPMKDALAKAAQVAQSGETFEFYDSAAGGTADNPTPSVRETKFGSNDANAVFYAGKLGFIWDASWAASARETNVADLFDYDFVGLPGSKVIGVSDYYGISKASANKAAAYEVVKYLTFGTQGINDAFDIIANAKANETDANGNPVILAMAGLPINEDAAIIDKWFATIPQPGFKEAYTKAANGELTVLMEGNKYVPGFITARFTYNTGIDMNISRPGNEGKTLSIGDFIWDAGFGKINYSDYMTKQLADAMNYELIKAQLQLANK